MLKYKKMMKPKKLSFWQLCCIFNHKTIHLMDNNERSPEKFKKIWRASFFGIAIVWMLMIFATAKALQGTGYTNKLVPIFGLGAAAIIIILTGILRRYL